ncbi:MAG: septum formation initiator family protein [Alphaproteobacteria bacterium]|nr:septum formation initiator family protein [Alphaproteobacteria bacterium]
MKILADIGRTLLKAAPPFLVVSAGLYFGFHALEGERGLTAHTRLSHEVEIASHALDETKAKRETLERRASLLRPSGLDLDMLDERARRVLGLVHPAEIVILQK